MHSSHVPCHLHAGLGLMGLMSPMPHAEQTSRIQGSTFFVTLLIWGSGGAILHK